MPLWGSSFITDPITPQGVFPCFNQVLSGFSSTVDGCTCKELWLLFNEESHLALPPSVNIKHISKYLSRSVFFLPSSPRPALGLKVFIFDDGTVKRQTGRQTEAWWMAAVYCCVCVYTMASANGFRACLRLF